MAVLLLVLLASCGKGPGNVAPEVIAVHAVHLPQDSSDPAWRDAPVHSAPLLLQDIVEPRLLQPSTALVEVQAMTDGARVVFRLSWVDSTKSDLPAAGRFSDACAIQIPAEGGPNLPAPQMGETGRLVEIAYWSASRQAMADGRPQDIHAIYPRAKVDHYPYEAGSLVPGSAEQRAMALRYAPARAVGNPVSGPIENPVQDLFAAGPGSLTAADQTKSNGKGRYGIRRWEVLLSRPLPAYLGPGGRGQIAFAVWEGGREEAGSRKMRTGWVPLSIERNP